MSNVKTLIQTGNEAYNRFDLTKAVNMYLAAYKELQPVYITENSESMFVYSRIIDCFIKKDDLSSADNLASSTYQAALQNTGLNQVQLAKVGLQYAGVLMKENKRTASFEIINKIFKFQMRVPMLPDVVKTQFQYYSYVTGKMKEMSCFNSNVLAQSILTPLDTAFKKNELVINEFERNSGNSVFTSDLNSIYMLAKDNRESIRKLQYDSATAINEFQKIEAKSKALEETAAYIKQNIEQEKRMAFVDVSISGFDNDILLILPENIFAITVVNGENGQIRIDDNGDFYIGSNGQWTPIGNPVKTSLTNADILRQYFEENPPYQIDYSKLVHGIVVVTGEKKPFIGSDKFDVVYLSDLKDRGDASQSDVILTETAIKKHGTVLMQGIKKSTKHTYKDVLVKIDDIKKYVQQIDELSTQILSYTEKINMYPSPKAGTPEVLPVNSNKHDSGLQPAVAAEGRTGNGSIRVRHDNIESNIEEDETETSKKSRKAKKEKPSKQVKQKKTKPEKTKKKPAEKKKEGKKRIGVLLVIFLLIIIAALIGTLYYLISSGIIQIDGISLPQIPNPFSQPVTTSAPVEPTNPPFSVTYRPG